MVLPWLVMLMLPAHHAAEQVTCDPAAGGEWQPECDLLDAAAIFAVEQNETARFERAVDVSPGLRLPLLNECPADLPLSRMVARVLDTYFHGCIPVLRYDRFLETSCGVQGLLSGALPGGFTHGRLSGTVNGVAQSPVPRDGPCAVPVLMLQHVEDVRSISRAGTSHASATVLVTASPLWRVEEFLERWEGRPYKLLIVASSHRVRPVISTQHLKPWFPHQINIVARHEPPFSVHRPNETGVEWTGIEPVLMDVLAMKLNFTYSLRIVPPKEGGTEVVRDAVSSSTADVGAGGMYFMQDTDSIAASYPYMQDCAAFMTRASTALPRHRAILGPFRLAVWLTLTAAYLVLTLASAAGPNNKKDEAAAKSRLDAFWLVYGTFTNAFSIRSRVWSDRLSVRLLISFYWLFTVIITAAYTSSIIAFVTIPVFPATIDSAEEILGTPGFRWGTLGGSGWDKWLQNSDDVVSRHIQAGFEWLPSVEDGIRNVSLSAKYAFLGSRYRLQYESSDDLAGILSGKKALHLGSQCFLPLLPSFIAAPPIRPALDPTILTLIQTGIVVKATRDIAWQEQRRRLRNTASGVMRVEYSRKMPHERRLGFEDVSGTFLVLGAGLLMGLTSFGVENFMRWLKVSDFANRMNSTLDQVRRRVSSRSHSDSGGSSRQSLRLRSGRLWSRTRGSRLGSVLDVVPERAASPAEETEHAQEPAQNGNCWAASAPDLDIEQWREKLEATEELSKCVKLRRPQSSN